MHSTIFVLKTRQAFSLGELKLLLEKMPHTSEIAYPASPDFAFLISVPGASKQTVYFHTDFAATLRCSNLDAIFEVMRILMMVHPDDLLVTDTDYSFTSLGKNLKNKQELELATQSGIHEFEI
jgi:hypothetical protein